MLFQIAKVTLPLIGLTQRWFQCNSNNAFIVFALIHHDKAILHCVPAILYGATVLQCPLWLQEKCTMQAVSAKATPFWVSWCHNSEATKRTPPLSHHLQQPNVLLILTPTSCTCSISNSMKALTSQFQRTTMITRLSLKSIRQTNKPFQLLKPFQLAKPSPKLGKISVIMSKTHWKIGAGWTLRFKQALN